MATVLKKREKKAGKIRWKLFFAIMLPTVAVLVVLWVFNSFFLGTLYENVKTEELKTSTDNVIKNLEKEDFKDRVLHISSDGNINFRIIETDEFKTLYSTGEHFDAVTYGWEAFGMLTVYEKALENGGEFVQYYTENESPVPEKNTKQNGKDADGEEMHSFRKRFRPVTSPDFFDKTDRHNDLLYAKITRLSDGKEIMVVADTRISPLDSTVRVIRYELIFCTVIVFVISLCVSFLLARRISRPIEKINKTAKKMAGGNFDVRFEGKGYREIEELNDTMNQTASELAKVDGLRRELVSNVSHDMRTPLTMIVGYGEAMRDIPGENNKENIQVIIDEANRLSEFVNGVLDLSKLQNGMEKTNKENFDISALLSQTVSRYSVLLSDEAGFSLDVPAQIYVFADKARILQVVNNLIDNAVNYANAPKKVGIKCYLTDRNSVRVEISDNGDGIDAQELPYIWDRYYRSKKSHKRNVMGAGIGLSIVNEILGLHSARYGVVTKEKVGSTFWFELEITE